MYRYAYHGGGCHRWAGNNVSMDLESSHAVRPATFKQTQQVKIRPPSRTKQWSYAVAWRRQYTCRPKPHAPIESNSEHSEWWFSIKRTGWHGPTARQTPLWWGGFANATATDCKSVTMQQVLPMQTNPNLVIRSAGTNTFLSTTVANDNQYVWSAWISTLP